MFKESDYIFIHVRMYNTHIMCMTCASRCVFVCASAYVCIKVCLNCRCINALEMLEASGLTEDSLNSLTAHSVHLVSLRIITCTSP